MCDALKEFTQNYARNYAENTIKKDKIQAATNLLLNGISVDLIAKSIPSLSRQFITGLSRQLQQPVG